jgi:hypothetical protein
MHRVTRSAAVLTLLAVWLPLASFVLYPGEASEALPPRVDTGAVTSFGSKVLLLACGMVGGALLTGIVLLGVKPKGHTSPALPLPRESASPLDNKPWIKLVEECVELLDELDRNLGNFEPARRELAAHVIQRVHEILERCGVQTIMNETIFDRNRHQPTPSGGSIGPGATIAETLSPGFVVANRTLRRARVRLHPHHPVSIDP